jgi:serine phosphatase RsbU (regulator of sigma subunit)/anti-sigma regulatory factor (Ser/Thr protein kinase)
VAVPRRARRSRNRHDDDPRWAERSLAALGEGVVTVDGDGRIAFANPATLAILGRGADDLVGRDVHDGLCAPAEGPAAHDRGRCPALAVASGAFGLRSHDALVQGGGGVALPVELTCEPLAGHGPPGAVLSFREASGAVRATEYYGEVLRLTERERAQREVVRQLQEAVTPRVPAVPGAELAVFELPADPSQPSGGDLYDWILLPDGDVHLVVVDVLGKGVAATKDALAIVHALRVLTFEGCPMEDLVARADRLLTAHDPNLVATLLVARYTPGTGRLRLAGGGHPPAFVVGPDATVREVGAAGIPIGWPQAGSFEVVELTVGRSETVLLYTDGLIEARRDILVGLTDLRAALAETAGYPVRHLPRILVERALDGAQRRDDTLALVLRRRVAPEAGAARLIGPFEHRFSPHLAAVPLARHLFGAWMEAQGVEAGDHADLSVVASELCSNGVRMSGGTSGGLVLRGRVEDDALVVEVEDDGLGFDGAVPAADEVPTADGGEGRGLFLVQSLVDDFEVRSDETGSVVRCVKRCLFPHVPPATPDRSDTPPP